MGSFFRKRFGARKPPPEASSQPTVPNEQQPEREQSQDNLIEPPQLSAACAQSVGMQRDNNEDSIFLLTTVLSGNKGYLPFGLYIIADGMGGHRYGELASSIAVRSVAGYLVQKLYTPLLGIHSHPPEESIQEMMHQAVQEANTTILREATGGGTTLTAVLILGDQMTVAHVGDSRAYAMDSNGSLTTLTRDHSLVKRLVELGQITTEEASVHPQRNVLYRALGQGEPFDADVSTLPLPKGGHILVCSDGLWGVVPEEKLSGLIQESGTLQDACQRLVNAANEAGGPDNISVILVRLPR